MVKNWRNENTRSADHWFLRVFYYWMCIEWLTHMYVSILTSIILKEMFFKILDIVTITYIFIHTYLSMHPFMDTFNVCVSLTMTHWTGTVHSVDCECLSFFVWSARVKQSVFSWFVWNWIDINYFVCDTNYRYSIK